MARCLSCTRRPEAITVNFSVTLFQRLVAALRSSPRHDFIMICQKLKKLTLVFLDYFYKLKESCVGPLVNLVV